MITNVQPGGRVGSKAARLLGTSAFRVTALAVAGLVITAAVVFGALFWQTNELLTAGTLRELAEDRAGLEEVARDTGLPGLTAVIAGRARPRTIGGSLMILVDSRGAKHAGNLDRWPSEFADKPMGGTFVYDVGLTAAGLPLTLPNGDRLLVARDLGEQTALLERIRHLFLIGFGLLSTAGLVAGLVASRLMLARVTQITDTSANIMSGDLSRRITLSGADDEFDLLATHLNEMLERIEQLMNAMREVSDNIAHDLKTPLSRLRSRAEAALRGSPHDGGQRDGLARVIEDADAIIQTFNALLLIARLEAGAVERSSEAFNLSQLLRDVCELYEPVAEEANQTLQLTVPQDIIVLANRQLIGQALANLIDNAIKYAAPEPGAKGSISVALTADTQRIAIVISDQGRGIAPGDRDRALRRFVRLDQSRTQPGTGLGLSLVGAVARLHNGGVELADNIPHGLRVTLALPANIRQGGG